MSHFQTPALPQPRSLEPLFSQDGLVAGAPETCHLHSPLLGKVASGCSLLVSARCYGLGQCSSLANRGLAQGLRLESTEAMYRLDAGEMSHPGAIQEVRFCPQECGVLDSD